MSLILFVALSLSPSPKPPCTCGTTCPLPACEGGKSCRCAARSLSHLPLDVLFGADVRALGAEDFDTRERAEARLSRWADLCYPLLDRPFSDLEVRRRAQRIRERAIPESVQPLALLAGKPLAEWAQMAEESSAISIGRRPGPDWALTWLRPDEKAPWSARVVINHYGERTRSQNLWKDWQTDRDGREATRLLCRDLLGWGIPPWLIREWLAVLREREEALAK